jgi:uncharacterized protein (TIGR04255 family)
MALDLPAADERVVSRSTVGMAICQVRFDTQDGLGGATAVDFHNRLGSAEGRYPKITSAEGITVEIGPQGPVQTGKTGWSFDAGDGSWTVTLLPDNMSLQVGEGAFAGWEDFAERFTEALAALCGVVSPALEQRLGLRVVDRISGTSVGVDEPSGWEPYINPRFLGPVVEPGLSEAIRGYQQLMVLDAGEGVTCNLRQGLASVLSQGSRSDYVVDCDIFREAGRQFDAEAILEAVGGFRNQVENIFSVIATPALLDALP